MGKITWTDRTDSGTPTGATTEVSASTMNEIGDTIQSDIS